MIVAPFWPEDLGMQIAIWIVGVIGYVLVAAYTAGRLVKTDSEPLCVVWPIYWVVVGTLGLVNRSLGPMVRAAYRIGRGPDS